MESKVVIGVLLLLVALVNGGFLLYNLFSGFVIEKIVTFGLLFVSFIIVSFIVLLR